MNRRDFIGSAPALASLPFLLSNKSGSSKRQAGRVIVRNGSLYDGLGNPPVTTDIVLEGGSIIGIGKNLDEKDARVIDATDMSVCPGFVDIHGHTDIRLFANRNAESKVRQGVTTEVVGQDGSSMGPWTDLQWIELDKTFHEMFGTSIAFKDLAGFFAAFEKEPASMNIASMIGLGTVRGNVIGSFDRPASDSEIVVMQAHVEEAKRAGACGISTGLEYTPGAFASTEEIIACCQPFSGSGLPYSSHMRNEDDRVLQAIEETLFIGSQADMPILVAHMKAQGSRNWWKAKVALQMIDAANESGMKVNFDRYPYVAYSTDLGSLFPLWAREGNLLTSSLVDDTLSPRIKAEVMKKIDRMGNWNAVQVTSVQIASYKWVEGKKLGDVASELGRDPYDFLVELTLADQNQTSMVGYGMSEENTSMLLAHPKALVCSDGSARATYGILNQGKPHPRTYGTFPRVLGHYVLDKQIMSMESAIRKMTSAPADLIRANDRGRLQVGAKADLVVFDPAAVKDKATFEDPHQYPVGIPYVLVNGEVVIEQGEHSGATPGQVVKPRM